MGDGVPVHNWLQIALETLRGAPDELVAEGKRGKDELGGAMHMIDQVL